MISQCIYFGPNHGTFVQNDDGTQTHVEEIFGDQTQPALGTLRMVLGDENVWLFDGFVNPSENVECLQAPTDMGATLL